MLKIVRVTRSVLFYLSLFILVLLNACSTVSKKDGPPPFYVDETKIPDAVPKPEPLSKYGNMSSYVVFGKRYQVMSSSRNYEEQGTASWYGTKFHAHHTSNGERYNMLAMTAAHKSLPLPTYVQVTNLANGKRVIVKVNDRGPFESNRLIDLSYVAAKKLGMLGHGTARVDVKAIDPNHFNEFDPAIFAHNHAPHYKSTQFAKNTHSRTHHILPSNDVLLSENSVHHSNVKSHSHMFIQVGAFRERARAEKLKLRLASLVSSPVKITGKGLYRVQIGPIQNVALADRITKRLRAAGLESHKPYQG